MLTKLLIKLFVKHRSNQPQANNRLAYGSLSGYVGITVNVFLFLLKLIIGLISGSIAITADAINNLSDAGAGMVTLLGFKVAVKPPDREHPFGHGRAEYIAGLIVAVIIIAVGLDFMKESVMRIFNPLPIDANNLILAIYAGTLLIKLWLFYFYRTIDKAIESKIIRAAAFDSLSDIGATFVILLAIFSTQYTTFPIDGCAGTVVATLVIIGGIGILRDIISPLLGECPDDIIIDELKERILSCPGIYGVHDIIIHNYGPNQHYVTAHVEVDFNEGLISAHNTMKNAESEVAKNMPVRLLLHCDPRNIEENPLK